MEEWRKFPENRPAETADRRCEYLVVWQERKVGTCFYLNGHFRIYGENKDRLITHWMPLPELPGKEAAG